MKILLTLAAVVLFNVKPLFSQDAQKYFLLGAKKLDTYNCIEALDYFNECLRQNPNYWPAYYGRGISQIYLGDYKKGCEDLAIAKKYNIVPQNPNLRKYFNFYCGDENDPIRLTLYKEKGLLPINKYVATYSRADTLRGALRPERSCFDVFFYNLTVRIIPHGKSISGNNEIYFKMVDPSRVIQIDLFSNLIIKEILWKGSPLKYQRIDNAVFITFPEVLEKNSKQIIKVSYEGKPKIAINPPWNGGFVWKKDNKGKKWIGVACEHLGASVWWPNKDHLSDEPDSMKINIEVPKKLIAISNGNLSKVVELEDKYKRFEWSVSYPINNYNVTFYAGNFVNFSDLYKNESGEHPLDYYVLPQNLKIAQKHFKQTLEVIKFYEEIFGAYPFWKDGFGLVESPYAGMEHQGAIAYGNGYDNPSNSYYLNKIYDYIIVHETAHEWWGNSLTVDDMADAWIHEGFATYAELLFLERKLGHDEYLKEISLKMQSILNIWPVIGNRNVNDNSFGGGDIYQKGAVILHNLRCTINNDSLFFEILKEFATQRKISIVTSNNFIDFVNEKTKKNFTPFFSKYLTTTSLPILKYEYELKDDKLSFTYRWEGVDPDFEMPFALQLNNNKSVRILATTKTQVITLDNASTFTFQNQWVGTKECAQNSFTYYWTSKTD